MRFRSTSIITEGFPPDFTPFLENKNQEKQEQKKVVNQEI